VNVDNKSPQKVVVIGAGPAGLTAAYELARRGIQPIVLEQMDKVGGIARTENYKGYHFDMGGHRFYTKSNEVNEMWHAMLGNEFLRRPRLSRIYYKSKFFHYPLKPINALLNLGIVQAILIILSYIRWQIFPYKQEETFEQWVTNRFGKRLFETFFKTYTEKVWGIPCTELKAEWAAQRIKDLSLKTALVSMFLKPKTTIKTLIEEFDYPRLGPGMMWGQVQHEIERLGGQVILNAEVVEIHREGMCIKHVVAAIRQADGSTERRILHTDAVISSMPVSEFIKKLDSAPAEVVSAASHLTYRDFLTVCLIVNKPELFPDNWIYVHSPEVHVGRIQNFKNWSPAMVPDPSKTSLGLEYFCNEGDEVWCTPDADLVELGKREIDRIGLANYADVEDGCVFRVPKAYPVYDADYRDYLERVKAFVGKLENFQTIGRNGLHRYNNQDHSMLSGMAAVRNLMLGERNDLWSINADKAYQEEIREDKRVAAATPAAARRRVIGRLDPISLGVAVGAVLGILISLTTLFLIVRGGENVGANLQLLGQFFAGYSVTPQGSIIGLIYGFVTGFIIGSLVAFTRNLLIYFSAHMLFGEIERGLLRRFLDYT
jgi:protoporphyrinogen oxidase